MSLDLETVSHQLRVALHEAADQLPSEPRAWEFPQRHGRPERRGSRAVVLAMAAAAALVIGFIVWPHDATNTISTPASGTRRVVFDTRGDTVRLPNSWSRAQAPLATELVDPNEILAVATFPLDAQDRLGSTTSTSVYPVRCVGNAPPIDALASMRKKDAFAWMVEWHAVASTDRPRPAHFAAREFEPRTCVDQAYRRLTGKSIFFTQGGRFFSIDIVVGDHVSQKREHQLYAILDSLRFSK